MKNGKLKMVLPGASFNEERRLRSLHASGLIDSGRDERFDRLIRIAQHIFKVPVSLISLVDEDNLCIKAGGESSHCHIPRDTSFSAYAILQTTPMIITDTCKDPRFVANPNVIGPPFIRFYVGYPVRLPDGETVGVFCLMDYQPRDFTSAEVFVLKDLAAIVEDEFSIIDASTCDELTGLLNRRGFSAIAEYSLMAMQRRNESLSLAYLDLDNFKMINDCWGHAQGDCALVDMAKLMESLFRNTDLICRQGGDEFTIMFPDTDLDTAKRVIDMLEKRVEEYNMTVGNPWQLGFSVGIVQFDNRKHTSLADLIDDADVEMYRLKSWRKKIHINQLKGPTSL